MIEAKVESQDTDAAGDVEATAEAEVKEEELAEEKPTQTGDTSDTAQWGSNNGTPIN